MEVWKLASIGTKIRHPILFPKEISIRKQLGQIIVSRGLHKIHIETQEANYWLQILSMNKKSLRGKNPLEADKKAPKSSLCHARNLLSL
jgi:hypothetical protein